MANLEALKIGFENEEYVKDKFIKQLKIDGYTISLVEKAPEKKFYDWDYQITIKNSFGSRKVSIEIKVDTLIHDTDNFYIEYKNTTHNEPSGIYASKADYLLYHDHKQNITYLFNIKQLKEFIENNKSHLFDTGCNDTGDSNARGYLLYKPIAEQNNIITRIL